MPQPVRVTVACLPSLQVDVHVPDVAQLHELVHVTLLGTNVQLDELRLFITLKPELPEELNVLPDREDPVIVRGPVVSVVKSNNVKLFRVMTRRMPSFEKLKTPADVRAMTCPFVPDFETVSVPPLGPAMVKFGTRVTCAPSADSNQVLFTAEAAQVNVTVPSRVAVPIEQPLKVRVMTLLLHELNVDPVAQLAAFASGNTTE